MENFTIIASPEFEKRLQEFGKKLQLNDFRFENKGAVRDEYYDMNFDIKKSVKFFYFAIMFPPALTGSFEYYNNIIDKFKSTVQEHVQQTNQPVVIQTDETTYYFDVNTPEKDYQEFMEEIRHPQFAEVKKKD